MQVQINGQSSELSSGVTALELIQQLGYENQRIALEVNEAIIPKSKHAEFALHEGDKIEIIKAVGGG